MEKEVKVFSIELTKEEVECFVKAFDQVGRQIGGLAIDIAGFIVHGKIAGQFEKQKENSVWKN